MTCPACGHLTQGDLIVARATAGAARVDTERALDKALSHILSAGADGVRWEALDGMSAEEVNAATRAEMRDVVLAALAPLRPS